MHDPQLHPPHSKDNRATTSEEEELLSDQIDHDACDDKLHQWKLVDAIIQLAVRWYMS